MTETAIAPVTVETLAPAQVEMLEALRSDPRLAGAALALLPETGGVVLSGAVCNIWQYQTLRALVGRAPVVVDVGIAATRRDDREIAAAVHDVIAAAGVGATARVRGGIVTLNGTADAANRAALVARVGALPGVVGIVDALRDHPPRMIPRRFPDAHDAADTNGASANDARRTRLFGGLLIAAGIASFVAGVALVIARFTTPTPVIVAVAVIAVVAGFALLANGVLALFAHPIWTEGTVRDCHPHMLNAIGLRRGGVLVLNVGTPEPFIVSVNAATYATLAAGDRVRVRHDRLNRARIYAVEPLDDGG